jgi:hypothetical protein
MERTGNLEAQVRAWAEQHGCSLRVLNGGHHWLFQKPGFMAEWWPSSAKLAVGRDYLHDHHAPHWKDVRSVLEQHLSAAPPNAATITNAGETGAQVVWQRAGH